MSFYSICSKYKDFNLESFNKQITKNDIRKILKKSKLNSMDFLALLSPTAEYFLEDMAQLSHKLTVQQFGKTILMYTPMYLANYCTNQCVYCGFNAVNSIGRNQLTFEEVEKESKLISSKGFRHILILTGDAKSISSVEYISKCVDILRKYFNSIGIEIYALEENEYSTLVQAGVDSLTIYQETYNEELYDKLHLKGPKKDYRFRLDAPERACKANIRSVNVGALLGLDNWQKDAFLTGLHAEYIQNKYSHIDVNVSMPRIRPHVGEDFPCMPVNDKNLVQFILALRLFIPRVGITMSTREDVNFRNNVLPLGVTKMSADSNTSVGGHSKNSDDNGQFDISDNRDLQDMLLDIKNLDISQFLKIGISYSFSL
ncbi:dehydroglycine synthase ThiH [Gottschalkia acidurici 9a]|uniref:Dehydroglycine synthase ThiH n=1 Tax=Gottschalkia acidurici (strain ATCC 7906 / DSM 604 / BCRC 14475 / CIP 104303 / KCTC 5404 / NCIMB 10678 / 9a) TaxID=1128398 RepID=K0AY63_GOTA9|nr:2-iminoacetate synthase ThiH [Gottschalkia acidurici]AFS78179.1 dehydroglycine synthase ThiH [Gottschalkia acidurici 9a]